MSVGGRRALRAAMLAVMTSACAPDDGVCATATRSIAGGLLVDTQESVDTMADVSRVSGTLLVSGDVESLAPLRCLRSVDTLAITEAPSLAEVPDLPFLEDIREFRVRSAASLVSIGKIGSREPVQRFSLRDVPSLELVHPLDGLGEIEYLVVERTGLSDLAWLADLELAGLMAVAGNEQLSDLAGLASLRSVTTRLEFGGNDELEACADWALYRSLERSPSEFYSQFLEADCPP